MSVYLKMLHTPFQPWRAKILGSVENSMFRLVRKVCFNELELIQTYMIQKPMLQVEVGTRALRASQNVNKRCFNYNI
jgi:hypothetical protein